LADTSRRHFTPNVVAAVVLAVIALSLLLWQRPWQKSDDAAVHIPPHAGAVLNEQFHRLSDARSEAEFVAAAGSTAASRAFARQAWSAREALGAQRVQLRYVGGGEAPDSVDGSTEAQVEVSWNAATAAGLGDAGDHSSAVNFRMEPQSDGTFAIRSARTSEGALPIWLAGKLTVERQPTAIVIRIDGGADNLPVESMGAIAHAAVAKVVQGTKGTITLVSPHTQAQMAQLVGQKVADIRQIAAVTTKLDGRSGTTANTVIVLNPAVFATMDRRAAQVVLTHEATHVLTRATGTRAETWVVEGFADFVALHGDHAPLSLSAGQILADVQAGNTPERLPSASDFSATSHGLGAVYESAWMIFRLLSERFSDSQIEAFYRSVLGGTPSATALKSTFGLTTAQLTEQWRGYLAKSASTVS